MKKFFKYSFISLFGLVVIAALFGNAEEDVPEETETDTKVEETSEMTDKDKEEAERKYEEEKAEEEREAKEKAEAERKQEEKKAKEEREAKEKREAEEKAKEEREAKQKEKEEREAKRKAEEEAEAQAKAEEDEKLRKENEAKEKAEQEGSEELYLMIMRESVGIYVDIQFDKSSKTYTMTPTDQGLIDEISMLPMGIGHEGWGILVDGMTELSESGINLVGEGYSISLVNPLNHENVILWIMDGEVIYNVIDDL